MGYMSEERILNFLKELKDNLIKYEDKHGEEWGSVSYDDDYVRYYIFCMDLFMKRQEFTSYLKLVTETTCIQYGRGRNCNGEEIQRTSFAEYWRGICALYMIPQGVRVMKYGAEYRKCQ